MKEHPEADAKIACLTDDAQAVAIPMPKGDDSKALVEAVNKALQEIIDEGKLSELSIKYFGGDITKPN